MDKNEKFLIGVIALVILFLLLTIVSLSAQNIGGQYVTSVYSPISQERICLVSENPHPDQADTVQFHLSNDTLEFEVEKKWVDHILWTPLNVNQGQALESIYIANFSSNDELWYICRGDECRWRTPLVEVTGESITLTMFQDWDWPAFTVLISEHEIRRIDALKLMEDGAVLRKEYTYMDPNFWFHAQ